MAATQDPRLAGGIAFTYPDFAVYELGRFLVEIAIEMQSVAVGWQVYEITKRPLDLGLVGLAQFLPGILLFLVTGHAADRFDRRKLLMLCYGGFAVGSGLLWVIALRGAYAMHAHVYPIYAVLVLVGAANALSGPVSRALLPQLVPEEHFPNAVAWNASVMQGGTILGPAVGGLIYALFRGPSAVYLTAMLTSLVALGSTLRIKPQMKPRTREAVSLTTVLAGFRYIWRHKLILGSISLDMFAVLLGGAVALLPVYAREILKTGPWGLGLLRSAPGVGGGIDGDPDCSSPVARPGRADHALVCGRLWCVHHPFRYLEKHCPFSDCFTADRRDRYGEHHHSRHLDSVGYPRRNARTGQRGGHAFHWGFQRSRAIRIRADRAMVRNRARRSAGGRWDAGRNRSLGLVVSRVAKSGSTHESSRRVI